MILIADRGLRPLDHLGKNRSHFINNTQLLLFFKIAVRLL
nr:MAG TPA_asm: hypothetical protein [Caudoviricetes sp.]